MEHIINRLDAHEDKDDRRFSQVMGTLDRIENNHLSHIQASVAEHERVLAKNSEALDWIKKLTLAALLAGIGSFVSSLFK